MYTRKGKGNINAKDTYIYREVYQKDTVVIYGTYNEERDFEEFDTHRIYWGEDGQRGIKGNLPNKHVKCMLLQRVGRAGGKANTENSYKARKLWKQMITLDLKGINR